MNCSILTFQFADNYGASLQAFALKEFIEKQGYTVSFPPYVPNHLKKFYSINPLVNVHTPRSVVGNILKLSRRYKPRIKFIRFRKEYLRVDREEVSDIRLKEQLEKSQIIVCGSDQIWNDDITGMITYYYASLKKNPGIKIAYAASFGKTDMSDFQKKCIKEFLGSFQGISVREPDGVRAIKNEIDVDVQVVLDPVFLKSAAEWKDLAEYSSQKPKGKYVLYYALKENKELIAGTQKIAETIGAKVICIHPIGDVQNVSGAMQIYGVGPIEFLYLTLHAEVVCTNSFHASAFAVLFGKKLFHIAHSDKETRVSSMLSRVGADQICLEIIDEIQVFDLSRLSADAMQEEISVSKEFLVNMLRGGKNKGL